MTAYDRREQGQGKRGAVLIMYKSTKYYGTSKLPA
jgi:hypothetical protein